MKNGLHILFILLAVQFAAAAQTKDSILTYSRSVSSYGKTKKEMIDNAIFWRHRDDTGKESALIDTVNGTLKGFDYITAGYEVDFLNYRRVQNCRFKFTIEIRFDSMQFHYRVTQFTRDESNCPGLKPLTVLTSECPVKFADLNIEQSKKLYRSLLEHLDIKMNSFDTDLTYRLTGWAPEDY